MTSEVGRLGYHPACLTQPTMQRDEFSALCASIAKGYQSDKPIALYDNAIVDGRHRYEACLSAGVSPAFFTLPADTDPYRYVYDVHKGRRNWLDKVQQAACELTLIQGSDAWQAETQRLKDEANAKRAEAAIGHEFRGNQHVPTNEVVEPQNEAQLPEPSPPPKRNPAAKAAALAAQRIGVSRATVERVITLQRHDEAHGTTLTEQVRDGAIKSSQALAVAKKAKLTEQLKAQVEQSPSIPVVRQQDAVEFLSSFDDASIDLLLTDPPYSTDVEDLGAFIASWLPLALSKVKASGRAYICIGAYPEELRAYLNALAQQERMTLANVLVWTYRNTLGPSPKTDYKLNWQAVLYLRGPQAAALDCPLMTEQFSVLDINAPDGRQGDRHHAWQKPVEIGERFVRHATRQGDLVVDPFACTGTFPIAAATLGRRAIGSDIDAKALAIAASRGCAVRWRDASETIQEIAHAA